MFGMSRLAEKLKIQNCINSTGNCIHYIDGLSGFANKLNIQNCINSTGIWVRYMYRLSGFVEKLNIQNSVIQRVIIYIICTECLDL